MNWRFWRRPKKQSLKDIRNMNEDWRRGDLAECISEEGFNPVSDYDPKFGDILRVTGIKDGVDRTGRYILYGLGFEGKPHDTFWITTAFRKLRPVNEPASEDFIKQITSPKITKETKEKGPVYGNT